MLIVCHVIQHLGLADGRCVKQSYCTVMRSSAPATNWNRTERVAEGKARSVPSLEDTMGI